MIYLIFMQYMKHRMQIIQEHWEYVLTTNRVMFMQQTCNCCQKVTVVFVTKTYCCRST